MSTATPVRNYIFTNAARNVAPFILARAAKEPVIEVSLSATKRGSVVLFAEWRDDQRLRISR